MVSPTQTVTTPFNSRKHGLDVFVFFSGKYPAIACEASTSGDVLMRVGTSFLGILEIRQGVVR